MGNIGFRLVGFSASAAEMMAPHQYRLPIFLWCLRRQGRIEPELEYLPKLMEGRTRRLALDVGANRGIYSYHLSEMFEEVVAFEPQRVLADKLAEFAQASRRNIRVENCGLSNMVGELEFRVPIIRGRLRTSLVRGCGSLENVAGPSETLHVAVKRLDDFAFENVDFVKIDVEGHELSALEGGTDTLTEWRPIVLAEVDHHPEVFAFMRRLGYRVEFLRDGALWPVDGDTLPEPCPRNFIFLPETP